MSSFSTEKDLPTTTMVTPLSSGVTIFAPPAESCH